MEEFRLDLETMDGIKGMWESYGFNDREARALTYTHMILRPDVPGWEFGDIVTVGEIQEERYGILLNFDYVSYRRSMMDNIAYKLYLYYNHERAYENFKLEVGKDDLYKDDSWSPSQLNTHNGRHIATMFTNGDEDLPRHIWGMSGGFTFKGYRSDRRKGQIAKHMFILKSHISELQYKMRGLHEMDEKMDRQLLSKELVELVI